MSLENLDLESFARQLTSHFAERLSQAGLPPEEVDDNVGIIEQFNNIAIGLLKDEPGISLPGTEQMIPWDEKTGVQGLTLFAEGIYTGMLKCFQQGIPTDIKKKLLQEFAMDVYTQAKQVVASTYGQEHTPEFQISHEQQMALIGQAAGNALMYYIDKHEREHGPIEAGPIPINPIEPAVTSSQIIEQSIGPTSSPPSASAPPPLAAPQPIAQPPHPQGPNPHDKYGAVALLLNTLPANQRARVLRQFTTDEKELIAFYSDPRHIEQNLDIASVQKHLQRFKALFKRKKTREKDAHQGLAQLAAQYPLEKLLSYVKDERPAVKQALEAVYRPPTEAQPLLPVSKTSPQKPASQALPSRIEEILYQHLQRRLEATPQRA
jgi:hypothetical protein